MIAFLSRLLIFQLTVCLIKPLCYSLAKACHFPSYFAHNWDSAWDCLTDSDVSHLQLCLVGVEKINTEDLNVFRSIIEDAYKDFGKPQLWIVVPSEDK